MIDTGLVELHSFEFTHFLINIPLGEALCLSIVAVSCCHFSVCWRQQTMNNLQPDTHLSRHNVLLVQTCLACLFHKIYRKGDGHRSLWLIVLSSKEAWATVCYYTDTSEITGRTSP